MGSYQEPRIKTFIAGADLSAKKNTFVMFGSNEKLVVSATLNARTIGILMNAPLAGEPAEVALPGGGALLKLAEAAALGKLLTSTATGTGEIADAAGEWVGAMAYEGGTTGDVIYVEVIAMQAQASDA